MRTMAKEPLLNTAENENAAGVPESHFWMGKETYKIPMSMYRGNRERLCSELRSSPKTAGKVAGVVLLKGGEQETRHCTDHEPLFRQESYFAYLFGVAEGGFYGSINVSTGKATLFIPRLPPEYAVWMGRIDGPAFFQEKYAVDAAYYVDEMPAVLRQELGEAQARECRSRQVADSGEPGDPDSRQVAASGEPALYLLKGLNTDSGNWAQPAHFEGIEEFPTDTEALHPVLSECRVKKSAQELEVLRYATAVSSAAHVEVGGTRTRVAGPSQGRDLVMRRAAPGMTEYQLESIFKHHVYYHGGCRHCSYTCICATSSNRCMHVDPLLRSLRLSAWDHSFSAVLHYGHAGAPNDRTMEDGDMALLDMGAEYNCYGADITCSFPVYDLFPSFPAFTPSLLPGSAVLAAQEAVCAAMRPGVSWPDMHRLAERKILEGLAAGGYLQGSVEEMMAEHLGAVFMPHGLGHLLGLDTHDVGGYNKGPERSDKPGLRSLRTARLLEEGMVLTVEPGCYFIDAVLLPAMEDAATSKFFVSGEMQKLRGTGGVRLEDDVVVVSAGIENMTKCPRKIEDVEAVMAGKPWP
eukprot:jgi/Mesen1/10183/ME000076S09693